MNNFFRKKRKKMADGNKPLKYIRYAVGEVFLIIIGILIALQLQNWNEKRKQEARFKNNISKVYTSINTNVQALNSYRFKLIKDVTLLEYFINKNKTKIGLNFNDIEQYIIAVIDEDHKYIDFESLKQEVNSIEDWQIPHLLFLLENFPLKINSNELSYYNDLINPDPDSDKQNDIAQKVIKFNNTLQSASFLNSKLISNFLNEKAIPTPSSIEINANYYEWKNLEFAKFNFTEKEIKLVFELLNSNLFISKLRSHNTNQFQEYSNISRFYEEGINLLNSIEEYYREVTLNYPNIGIVGDALDGWLIESTPMELIDAKLSKWEIKVALKDGAVKFRSDNSWTNNWGGTDFPNGKILYWGGNIPVKKGTYHIILNLTENSYQFIKLDD